MWAGLTETEAFISHRANSRWVITALQGERCLSEKKQKPSGQPQTEALKQELAGKLLLMLEEKTTPNKIFMAIGKSPYQR